MGDGEGGGGEPTDIFFMAFDLLLGQVSPSYEEKPLGGRRRAVVKQRDYLCLDVSQSLLLLRPQMSYGSPGSGWGHVHTH